MAHEAQPQGYTTISFNEATMIKALDYYLNHVVFSEDVDLAVVGVSVESAYSTPTFKIEIAEREDV